MGHSTKMGITECKFGLKTHLDLKMENTITYHIEHFTNMGITERKFGLKTHLDHKLRALLPNQSKIITRPLKATWTFIQSIMKYHHTIVLMDDHVT